MPGGKEIWHEMVRERERERKEDKAKINVDEEGRKGKYKKRR